MLFPFDPTDFWEKMRVIIREELEKSNKGKSLSVEFETPGLQYKPLYKMAEICVIFHVTRPTIYEWVKLGKLKPYKIRSRVYFLWDDVQRLINGGKSEG